MDCNLKNLLGLTFQDVSAHLGKNEYLHVWVWFVFSLQLKVVSSFSCLRIM